MFAVHEGQHYPFEFAFAHLTMADGDARLVVRRESFDDLLARDVAAEEIAPDAG